MARSSATDQAIQNLVRVVLETKLNQDHPTLMRQEFFDDLETMTAGVGLDWVTEKLAAMDRLANIYYPEEKSKLTSQIESLVKKVQ